MKITDLRCAVIGRHPIVRVVTDVLEDRGIDDTGAAHLEPAGVFAEDAAFPGAEEARDIELD